MWSAFVWLYGIIGYYHRKGFGESDVTEVTETPLPRELLALLLFLIGTGFVLAGTPTGVGAALGRSAHASVMLHKFAKESYEMILSAAVWVAIIAAWVTCVIRRELFVGMVVLTALLGLAGGILYFSYRLNPGVPTVVGRLPRTVPLCHPAIHLGRRRARRSRVPTKPVWR